MKTQEPTIQPHTLHGLPEVLRIHGVEPDGFLQNFGLSVEELAVRSKRIRYWAYADVLRGAAIACQAPHLGLLLSDAASHGLYSRGMLGMLLKSCKTVGETLKAAVRYYRVISSGASYALRVNGEEAYFERKGLVPGLRHDPILQDLSLSDFVNLFRKAIGPEWAPGEVFFSHEPPENSEPYEQTFKCRLTFGSELQAIRFPSSDLDLPVQASSAVTEHLLRDMVSRPLARPETRFAEAVTQVIDVLLPTGLCCVDSVATVFDMHPRTLHRRLRGEDSAFAALLEARRKEHGAAYLKNTSMSVAEVALALGYSAPEAFTRAFRKWFGHSPALWRRQAREINRDSPS